MTDDTIDLSRRKILAGLGAVGAAGAGAGLGTNALFSDEASFEQNTITAGELSLMVDWEEHYSYPQLYGFEDPTAGLDNDVVRGGEAPSMEYVGFPDPENPVVWIHEDDLAAYMANTAIEAFPDPDGDGEQEVSEGEFVYDPCEDGAHLPEDLDPAGLRTDNADTNGEDGPAPLVNLTDVKPGDFGEFTLSFHLCDNPGYVWLQAGNVSESEGGMTDPESAVDDSPADPELAEQIETVWWYDPNGNNVIDESIGEVDVMLAVDTSGSLSQDDVEDLQGFANDIADDLEATGNARVGGLSFGDGTIDDFVSLADGPPEFSGLTEGGNTPMPAALDVASEELDVNARSGAETFIIMFTDGGPNYPNDGYDEFPIGGGFTPGPYSDGDGSNGVVEDPELCETYNVAEAVRSNHRILGVGIDDSGQITDNPDAEDCDGNAIATLREYLRDYIAGDPADYYSAEAISDVEPILGDILEDVARPEKVFRRGTLASDLDLLADGDGLPLDARPSETGERDCFNPGVTNYVGFAWWLPVDAGNEVQTDSVGFDLGFYAEQCRHNGTPGS